MREKGNNKGNERWGSLRDSHRAGIVEGAELSALEGPQTST